MPDFIACVDSFIEAITPGCTLSFSRDPKALNDPIVITEAVR
jgi:hypothetical protein